LNREKKNAGINLWKRGGVILVEDKSGILFFEKWVRNIILAYSGFIGRATRD
jgi:hypothetical protein